MTLSIGLEILAMEDPQELLCAAKESGFDFGQSSLLPLSASASLMNAIEEQDQTIKRPLRSMDVSQLLVTSPEEARNLYCGLAPWTDLDSNDTEIRVQSQDLLRLQGQWASHLAAKGVVVYLPSQGPLNNFARCLGELLGGFATGQVYCRSLLS
jgi:protein arginine N-methyltransferase 5